jgi:hypothetical protein
MEDVRNHDDPPLLDYRPTALPADAVNVLRPAGRSIVVLLFALQAGLTGFFVVVALFDPLSRGRSVSATIKLVALASLLLLAGLTLLGVMWWLSVRRLRWAIREEALIIARGHKIARNVSWSDVTNVDVRSHGVVIRIANDRQIIYLSPLGRRDGEGVRRAWLERGVRTAT